MLCTDTVSFWIKGVCQKAELVARNDCKYFPTFNFSFLRSICVLPIDFNFLEFVASEAHKSCSASVDIHIKASLSWATWHGTHNCWGTELWHVSIISTVISNFWRPNVLIICFSLYNICEYTQCKSMLIG